MLIELRALHAAYEECLKENQTFEIITCKGKVVFSPMVGKGENCRTVLVSIEEKETK